MKKNIFLICVFLLGWAWTASAVPAKPGTFKRRLPNGSEITLQLHGDEFYHWTTTEDGTVVEPDANGYYIPAQMPAKEQLGGRMAAMRDAARIRAKRAKSYGFATRAASTWHFPVILVQFSDVHFTVSNPQQAFSNLLNQVGYNENGAIGSVHDYYWENSMQTFDAQFDVFGPYTYNGTCAANAEETDAAKILWDAIRKNDAAIDWSRYDNDGDGVVDLVFMYYAGYNEAEGVLNTIWPHKYDFANAGITTSSLDGKSFDVYACTSELKGTSGEEMCGIGTCAHEFSHTQGLPDFYDVNYAKYSGDTQCGGTYEYDIMCSGSYNDDGRIPPYFSAEERILMGWLNGYQTLPSSGEITIPSIATNFGYKMNSNTANEYFVFESRPGTGWDSPLQPGMIVYHIDKSSSHNIKYYYQNNRYYTFSAAEVWGEYYEYNLINADGTHPCYYLIPAADQSNLAYSSMRKIPFPGAAGVLQYTPVDWNNRSYDLLYNIIFHSSNGSVTLYRGEPSKGVSGLVRNSAGEGIGGAKVSIYVPNSPSGVSIGTHGPDLISGRIPGNLRESVMTDEDGFYTFDLSSYSQTSLDIEVTAEGYITKYQSFEVPSNGLATKNFTLRGIHEPVDYTLHKYELSLGGMGVDGYGQTATSYGAARFSASDLSEFVGRKILRLYFAYAGEDDTPDYDVYGIIDFGGTRVLTSRLSSPVPYYWIGLDVSGQNLYIPANTDCHFGYALVQCPEDYPYIYSSEEPKEGGWEYYITSSTSISTKAVEWLEISGANLLIHVVLDDSSEVDYNSIDNPGYGTYHVGQTLTLKLNEAEGVRKPGTAITWYYDDETVSGSSITFKYPGTHLIEARFTTTEGKTKIVELEVNVN